MSNGDRGKFSKAGLIFGLISVATFCAICIKYGLSQAAEYQREADNKNREYSAYTSSKIAKTCITISALEKAKCVYEARDQEREYNYNQNDLVAQRQSAFWAFIMSAAAVIGMALSALGVWLVKTTFDETRKANILSKAQQRARIVLDFNSGIGNETGNLVVLIKGKNIGHSTATNCQITVHDGFELPQKVIVEEGILASHTIAGQSSASIASYSRPDHRADGYYLYGVVTYDCIFGDVHKTYFCVSILPSRKVPDHTTSNLINAIACKPTNWPKDT